MCLGIHTSKRTDYHADCRSASRYGTHSGYAGLVGLIVEKESSLWDIAKEYNTTVESIMQLNDLSSDHVAMGDHLLLVKQLDGI